MLSPVQKSQRLVAKVEPSSPPPADVPRAPDHQRGRSQRARSHRELVQEEEGVQGTRPHRGAIQVPW